MGGCSNKQSAEHYVTRGLWTSSDSTNRFSNRVNFSKDVTVSFDVYTQDLEEVGLDYSC